MKITLTYDETHVTALFEGNCARIWGLYRGTREHADAWLRKGRSAMELRWMDVAEGVDNHGDLSDEGHATYRWLVEECPPMALAVMCAEWGNP